MKIRFSGSWIPATGSQAPSSHEVSGTVTSWAPKIVRNACCMIRLMPQVASSVSRGRL